jgi:uncharacterized protein (DUF1810 family)
MRLLQLLGVLRRSAGVDVVNVVGGRELSDVLRQDLRLVASMTVLLEVEAACSLVTVLPLVHLCSMLEQV